MEPRIVEKPEIILVGMPFFGNPADGAFAKTWDRLMKHIADIPARANEIEFFGVEFYTEDFDQSRQWYYMACVEVTDPAAIPIQMVSKRLPACSYAVFTVTGGLKQIHEVFGYAYHTWLPNSLYQIAYPYDFEFYEMPRYKGDVEGSELDLYVPIKEK